MVALKALVESLSAGKRRIAQQLLSGTLDMLEATAEAEIDNPEALGYQPSWMAVLYLVEALQGERDGPFWGEIAFTVKDSRVVSLKCPRTLRLWPMYFDLAGEEGEEGEGE